MSRKEINPIDDPFLQERYRLPEFLIVAAAVVVMVLVAGVALYLNRRKLPSALPPMTEKEPEYTVRAYHPELYKITKLRVNYVGQKEEIDERYDDYEVKGNITRPRRRVSDAVRMFVTMRAVSGQLNIKKVQQVVEQLPVGKAKEFAVHVPDMTFARIRNSPLEFIVMVDQELPQTPSMATGISVHVAEDPLSHVAIDTGRVLEQLDALHESHVQELGSCLHNPCLTPIIHSLRRKIKRPKKLFGGRQRLGYNPLGRPFLIPDKEDLSHGVPSLSCNCRVVLLSAQSAGAVGVGAADVCPRCAVGVPLRVRLDRPRHPPDQLPHHPVSPRPLPRRPQPPAAQNGVLH